MRKSETGRKLDGRTYDEFPELTELELPDKEQRLLALREIETEYRVGAVK